MGMRGGGHMWPPPTHGPHAASFPPTPPSQCELNLVQFRQRERERERGGVLV